MGLADSLRPLDLILVEAEPGHCFREAALFERR